MLSAWLGAMLSGARLAALALGHGLVPPQAARIRLSPDHRGQQRGRVLSHLISSAPSGALGRDVVRSSCRYARAVSTGDPAQHIRRIILPRRAAPQGHPARSDSAPWPRIIGGHASAPVRPAARHLRPRRRGLPRRPRRCRGQPTWSRRCIALGPGSAMPPTTPCTPGTSTWIAWPAWASAPPRTRSSPPPRPPSTTCAAIVRGRSACWRWARPACCIELRAAGFDATAAADAGPEDWNGGRAVSPVRRRGGRPRPADRLSSSAGWLPRQSASRSPLRRHQRGRPISDPGGASARCGRDHRRTGGDQWRRAARHREAPAGHVRGNPRGDRLRRVPTAVVIGDNPDADIVAGQPCRDSRRCWC